MSSKSRVFRENSPEDGVKRHMIKNEKPLYFAETHPGDEFIDVI